MPLSRPADTDNNRISVHRAADGAFARALRSAVPFEAPDACALVARGRGLVVSEFLGRRLQLLSRAGRLLQARR